MIDTTIDFSAYSPQHRQMDDTCMDILSQMVRTPVSCTVEVSTQVDLPKECRTIDTQTLVSVAKLRHAECQATTKKVNKFSSCVVKHLDAGF
jgi:flagellar motor switch protein FliM